MIRPGRQPRPDSCGTSADVLSAPERHAEMHRPAVRADHFPDASKLVYRDTATRWADYPHIADVLNLLRSKL